MLVSSSILSLHVLSIPVFCAPHSFRFVLSFCFDSHHPAVVAGLFMVDVLLFGSRHYFIKAHIIFNLHRCRTFGSFSAKSHKQITFKKHSSVIFFLWQSNTNRPWLIFTSLPPIQTNHLKRFECAYITWLFSCLNDRTHWRKCHIRCRYKYSIQSFFSQ